MSLNGKTILVTGGSRGIGRAIAVAIAEAGADIVITARSDASGEETAMQIRAMGRNCLTVPFDHSSGRAAMEAVADLIWIETGGIDAVFNNAGNVLFKPALETEEAEWSEAIATNLSGLFWSCQSFGARMLDRGQGKIINVASDIGIRGESGWAAYAASKGGVVALSKSLAWEWAPKLTVNIIAPGPFYTDANRPAFDMPEVMEAVSARVPMGRVGDPAADLGPLAVLLSGPGSDFMTGAIFRVDGGICRS